MRNATRVFVSGFLLSLGVALCSLPTATALGADVGRIVWRDSNGDGLRNPNEPGVPRARVRLYVDHNGDGFPERIVKEAVTDSKGQYLFKNIEPGKYSVGLDLISLPEDLYEITSLDVGNNESNDSDVDPHITRSLPFTITNSRQDLSDRGDIGLLPGDGEVTYRGVMKNGNHLYTYQDLYLRTPHPDLPPGETRTHFDLNAKWIKWYALATRRQQMIAKKPGWLDTQRRPFAPNGGESKPYRGIVNGFGEGSQGYQDGRGFWQGGADYNQILKHPDAVGPHTITIYEGYRGTPARILWRTTSNEEVLFPWLMTCIETYLQSGDQLVPPHTNTDYYPTMATGIAALDRWERRVGKKPFTEVLTQRYGLLQNTNVVELDYLPKGAKKPERTRLRSSVVLGSILQKVMLEHGLEKFEEAMDNLSLVKFWPSSVELSAINFKKAINDATDGAYADKFVNDWGFPREDAYVPKRGITSGPYVDQDVYRWHFTSDVDEDIPSDYRALTNHMTEGMTRFTSPINEVGYVDVNERGNILGRPLYYANDRYSHVIAALYDVSWAQKVKNGFWAVTIDTADRFSEIKIEDRSFGSYAGSPGAGYNRLGLNYVVEVRDGELNIEFPASAPPAQIKYFGGFSLHYLGSKYRPATLFRAKRQRDKYNYNFGGDLLTTEPVPDYDSILPTFTDPRGTFWWRSEPGSERSGLTLSEAYHAHGLQETRKTGVLVSAGGSAAFSHKVKNGLWRVAVELANVGRQATFSLSAEGNGMGSTTLGTQKHGTITGYVGVKDGQLDIDVQGGRGRLAITSLELDYVTRDVAELRGTVQPDLTNTVAVGGGRSWLHEGNKGPRWRNRELEGGRVVTADESFMRPNNDFYQLATTIKGLQPGVAYEVGLDYVVNNRWAIKAGLNRKSLRGFSKSAFSFGGDDYVGPKSGLVEPTGRKIASLPVYRAKLGQAVADARGQIKVYVDDPNNAGVNSDTVRAWYAGVTYQLADFKPIAGLGFVSPTPKNDSRYIAGDNISVELKADVPLKEAFLYRNGVLAGKLESPPWKWKASRSKAPLLSSLPVGAYEFRAEVTSESGVADQIEFAMNVVKLGYKPNRTRGHVRPSAINTEAVDGRDLWFATGSRPPLWKFREEIGVFTADEARSGKENDFIQLKTTLFGLRPRKPYEVFLVFGSTGNWAIMGGLDQDAMEGFAAKGLRIGGNKHLGVDHPSGRVTKIRRTTKTGTALYRAYLGTAVANENGRIEVFIDDPDNAGISPVDVHRAWFDGISYRLKSKNR